MPLDYQKVQYVCAHYQHILTIILFCSINTSALFFDFSVAPATEQEELVSTKRLRLATSVMSDGSMGTSKNYREYEHLSNILRFFFKHGIPDAPEHVTFTPVHGKRTALVDASNAGTAIPDCDGIYTFTPRLPLLARSQDCAPVLLFDENQTFVAALHAGWRGAVAGILGEFVRKLNTEHGIDPATVHVKICPCLLPCCFEIQQDVCDKVLENFPKTAIGKNTREQAVLNLVRILAFQASDAGIRTQHISNDWECTSCTKNNNGSYRYFSWRRDHTRGNNMCSVIVLL